MRIKLFKIALTAALGLALIVPVFGQGNPKPSASDYVRSGASHYKKQDYDKAIEDANAAIRLDPKLWNAYGLRAMAYNEKKDYNKAIEDYTIVIRLKPDFAEAYNGRAWIYAWNLKKEFDRAIADANQAIKLDPKDASYYDTRGWAYFGKGDYNNATDDFNKAIKLDPNQSSSKDGLKKISEAQVSATNTFTDSRDGKTYKIVKIGEQIWMAENLGYNANGLAKCYGEDGKVIVGYKKGIRFPIEPNYKTLSNTEIQDNCNRYGRLYNWNTALNS